MPEASSAQWLLQDLAASQLAGVACALIAAESASRPAISAAYEPSQPVCHAIEALEADRERLYNLQLQAGVAQPLNVDLRLSGTPHLQPYMLRAVLLLPCSASSHMRDCRDIPITLQDI